MFKLRQLQKQKQEELISRKVAGDNQPVASAARQRLQRDLDALELPPMAQLEILPAPAAPPTDLPRLRLRIAPDEGYYKGGTFTFDIEFSEAYPIEPPRIRCSTRIFHPNIDYQGKICLNILREDWSPALELQSVVIGIIFLFQEVSEKDPLNKDAATMLSRDPIEFAHAVRRSMAGNSIHNHYYDNVLH